MFFFSFPTLHHGFRGVSYLCILYSLATPSSYILAHSEYYLIRYVEEEEEEKENGWGIKFNAFPKE